MCKINYLLTSYYACLLQIKKNKKTKKQKKTKKKKKKKNKKNKKKNNNNNRKKCLLNFDKTWHQIILTVYLLLLLSIFRQFSTRLLSLVTYKMVAAFLVKELWIWIKFYMSKFHTSNGTGNILLETITSFSFLSIFRDLLSLLSVRKWFSFIILKTNQ